MRAKRSDAFGLDLGHSRHCALCWPSPTWTPGQSVSLTTPSSDWSDTKQAPTGKVDGEHSQRLFNVRDVSVLPFAMRFKDSDRGAPCVLKLTQFPVKGRQSIEVLPQLHLGKACQEGKSTPLCPKASSIQAMGLSEIRTIASSCLWREKGAWLVVLGGLTHPTIQAEPDGDRQVSLGAVCLPGGFSGEC